jgi:hypothetical protein
LKIVMIANQELPAGILANTTAVLGISLGRMVENITGDDLTDADGNRHSGITSLAIPILGATREQIKQIRDCDYLEQYADVAFVGFSEVAQRCLDYEEYRQRLGALASADIYYLGICLYGPKKKVNKLTGMLGLLR